jgi:hypothetical protein
MNIAVIYSRGSAAPSADPFDSIIRGNDDLVGSGVWTPPQPEPTPLPIYPLPGDLPPGGAW